MHKHGEARPARVQGACRSYLAPMTRICNAQDNNYLTSVEVAQTPIADAFFPLAKLKHTRVLGSVAEAFQWGKPKVSILLSPVAMHCWT